MKKLENVYAGVGGRKLVGCIDIDAVPKDASQLDIISRGGKNVGFISVPALKLAFKERKKEIE